MDLLEKKSDGEPEVTWDNGDWLCKPKLYGTMLDLITDHHVNENDIFEGP